MEARDFSRVVVHINNVKQLKSALRYRYHSYGLITIGMAINIFAIPAFANLYISGPAASSASFTGIGIA